MKRKLLQLCMCGRAGAINPYEAVRPPVRQQILVLINRVNLRVEEIAEKLGLGLEEVVENVKVLKEAGLVRDVNGLLSPSFAIFTLEDYELLKPLLEELSLGVKKVVEEKIGNVKSLIGELGCARRGLSFPDLDYIVVGAFTLDYEALGLLRDEGLLVVGKEMPGGGQYVFAGFEWPVELDRAWMWGHTYDTPKGYWFSTHGKLPPRGPRMAFPDLAYIWMAHVGEEMAVQRLEVIGELLELLSVEDLSTRELAVETGRCEDELLLELNLLWALDYVVHTKEFKWRINRPFFTVEDIERIRTASRTILRDIVELFENRLPVLKTLYTQTAPSKNEIPFEEAFNFLYHLIFEKALETLIEEKTVSEPPLRLDGGKYSPFVARLRD